MTVKFDRSIIKWDTALANCGGNRSTLVKSIDLFKKELCSYKKKIESYYNIDDKEAICDICQSLMCKADTLACKDISYISSELEKSARAGINIEENIYFMKTSIDLLIMSIKVELY